MLSRQDIQVEISKWMARLFEKDIHVSNVKLHVEKLTDKILTTELQQQCITKEKLIFLFEDVEREFRQR